MLGFYSTSLTGIFCFQRLEFLGDAVLDILLTRHLFLSHNEIGEGELTDLRSASVNNENFAQVSVKYNLHLLLLYFNMYSLDFNMYSHIRLRWLGRIPPAPSPATAAALPRRPTVGSLPTSSVLSHDRRSSLPPRAQVGAATAQRICVGQAPPQVGGICTAVRRWSTDSLTRPPFLNLSTVL
jgi:hypothetical protein